MSPRQISILAIVLLSVGGAVAIANPKSHFSYLLAQQQQNAPRSQNHARNGLIQVLNLSKEQVKNMKAIQKQYKDKIAQNSLALRQAKQELSDMIAGTASAEEVRKKHHQVVELQEQLENLRFESMLATRELLNLEQRRKFVERMQKRQVKPQNSVGNSNKSGAN